MAIGGLYLASNFISCSDDDQATSPIPANLSESNFDYGVASFDPTSSQVIIWTRYTSAAVSLSITWQIASDAAFQNIIRTGEVTTDASRDYTVAIEIQELAADQKLYYRFIQPFAAHVSPVGETITFPTNASQVTMAVCSCSNYPAGLFNVYKSMAVSDADVILHLGDYIYEYGQNQYGTNQYTATLGRAHSPANEILTLNDYRTRYKQYRSDANLKLAHQKKPFICVWDDHEITNDTYIDGAENHQPNEGSFEVRKQHAIQAYSEYIAVRTTDKAKIYRNFNIGNLVNLIMLDTRVIGRDKQLAYATYFDASGNFNIPAFQSDLMSSSRTMLGTTQRNWLLGQLSSSTANWQVLGQQVLMGKMFIPMELLLGLNQILAEIDATGSVSPTTFAAFTTLLTQLVTIKFRLLNNDPTLTPAEIARVQTTAPYNLDAWDGYAYEREVILNSFAGKKVVCLAGDTHNGWESDLRTASGTVVGKEFATSSVSSPGFETYLGLAAGSSAAITEFENAIQLLIDDLNYLNASDRGFLKVTFTPAAASAEYVYVNTVFSNAYSTVSENQVSYAG